jgi:spore germination cell wall hydrolase CwlJ-like protein
MALKEDLDTLARTLWGEARNQGREGMAAVANVIVNRVDIDLHNDKKPDWWGEGFHAVCRKPWQFSCWNPNDPNLVKLKAVTEDDLNFLMAVGIAADAISGNLPDRTHGATHYFAPKALKALGLSLPDWALRQHPTAIIGAHVFYRQLS